MYHRWPRRIGEIDVCLIQLPARENRIREPHYETYERLAADLVDLIAPLLQTPSAFFGHCGGILPAVELTRQLQAARLPVPRRLLVSSQVAPHDGPYGSMLGMTSDQLADKLREIVISLGGQPVPALIELGLELLQGDIEANRRYLVPEPDLLPSAITVIAWANDDEFPLELMQGWRQWTADYREVLLDGEHYGFLDAPAHLLAEVERDLCTPAPV